MLIGGVVYNLIISLNGLAFEPRNRLIYGDVDVHIRGILERLNVNVTANLV